MELITHFCLNVFATFHGLPFDTSLFVIIRLHPKFANLDPVAESSSILPLPSDADSGEIGFMQKLVSSLQKKGSCHAQILPKQAGALEDEFLRQKKQSD